MATRGDALNRVEVLPPPAARLRLRVRSKLIIAFLIVLAPMVGVTGVGLWKHSLQLRDSVLQAQQLTAQALGSQIEEAMDAALGVGTAVAMDPVVQRLDPAELDAHLSSIVKRLPSYVALTAYNAQGDNRGWGDPLNPSEPRISIARHAYFPHVMATGKAFVSEVHLFQRPIVPGFTACVPIPGPDGKPKGVIVLRMPTETLSLRWKDASLLPGQAIFLADPVGRLAFHTRRPQLKDEESVAFASLPSIQSALTGGTQQLDGFVGITSEEPELVSFSRTPKYGWLVGVTVPHSFAFAPLRRQVWLSLVGAAGIGLLVILLVVTLSRLLTGPVRALTAQAEALGRGDSNARVAISSGDELEELGQTFNRMTEQLRHRTRELADAQQVLLRHERLAVLGQLAGGVAHQIRNPLGAIMNAASILGRHLGSGAHPDAAESLRVIGEEIRHANVIITGLLDFARVHTPKRQPTAMSDVIDRVLGSQPLPDSIRVQRAIGEVPRLSVDADLIQSALWNVVRNAVEAMPQGGTLGIQVGLADGEVVTAVTDTGPGISAAVRDHLFEPLHTTKPMGVGLGLLTARNFVEAHGGHLLSVDVPAGARFEIRLPLAR